MESVSHFSFLSHESHRHRSWGLFLETPGNVLGLKSCFIFAMFVFKIKVSLILKMRQRNYQLMKQINQFVSKELCYYSTGFDFKVCLRARKVTGTLEERAPDAATGMFVKYLFGLDRIHVFM